MAKQEIFTQNYNFSKLKHISEFLSYICPWQQSRTMQPIADNPYTINIKNIAKLFVEISYLIHHLHRHQQHGHLSKKPYLTHLNIQQQQIKYVFVTQEEFNQLSPTVQTYITNEFNKIDHVLDSKAVIRLIMHYLEMIQEIFNVCVQKKYLTAQRINQGIIHIEFQQFYVVYYNFLKNNAEAFPTVQHFIKALQETKIFRQYSLMLRFTNNSIILKILMNEKCQQDLKKMMKNYQIQRVNMLKSQKQETDRCESLMQQFFRLMISTKAMQVNMSLNENGPNSEGNEKKKEEVKLGRPIQAQHTKSLCFSINTQQKKYQFLTPQRLQQIISNVPEQDKKQDNAIKRSNQYQINFKISSNQLIIKLYTCHMIKFQQLDLVNSLLNYLNQISKAFLYTFDQNNKKLKINDKCLVLYMHVILHPKQHPFMAILNTIDRLIIASIVLDYQIKIRSQLNTHKRQLISQQILYLHQKLKMLTQALDVF